MKIGDLVTYQFNIQKSVHGDYSWLEKALIVVDADVGDGITVITVAIFDGLNVSLRRWPKFPLTGSWIILSKL